MLYEYAVDPALFAAEPSILFIRESFGINAGRLISEYPRKDWVKMARARISASAPGDVAKKRWGEALVHLIRHALYERHDAIWNDALSWTDNALSEHSRRMFQGILTDTRRPADECVLVNDLALSVNPRWRAPTPSADPARTAEEMVRIVQPLLDCSKSLILIDKHFDPRDGRFLNVLVEFSKYLKSRVIAPQFHEVKFVVSDKAFDAASLEAQCASFVPSRLPKGITVKFYVKAQRLLHDRFVLTDRGGVQYGIGLDERPVGDSSDVLCTRLSESSYRKQIQVWDKDAYRIFDLLGSAP